MSKGKTIALAGLTVLALGVTGALYASKVEAADATTSYPAIVQAIAEKFNLNADEVHTVFVEDRQARTAERLDEAVANGDITETQKALIAEKQAELEAKREELRDSDLTIEEHREQMQTDMDELRAWAEENDIPMNLLNGKGRGMGEGMGNGGQGMGRGMHR